MDDRRVCAPLFAESDAQNTTISTPHAASVTDADKVINTNTDNTQVEGVERDEELLKGLLADDYCHVCEAVLLFESQRLSHYEGKKHAQKVRVYLQAKRAEKMNKEATGSQQNMTTDKNHFCELCNMVFSSQVVAKSHYEGKVHTKNVRKQGYQPPVIDRHAEVQTLPSLSRNPDNAIEKSSQEGITERLDPTVATISPRAEVDLKDPNKYCVLCAASFNNPQMASQHYNGRKHQRNQSRQELLKELGDDVRQANGLMCQMCGVQFNSVEMFQAHMQGNKHQIREKKVINLCKSQQKVYNTFTDELSDYIQIQKARGITPKPPVLPPGNTHNEDDEDEEDEVLSNDILDVNKPLPNFPPTYDLPHHSRLNYNPVERCPPSYQALPWPSHSLDYNHPPPVLPVSASPFFNSQPIIGRKRRRPSSSSSYVTSSSYSSSYSCSTSESDDSEYRSRVKRGIRRPRREKEKRLKNEDSAKEEKRNKSWKRERQKDSEERRRGETRWSEEERRRKKRKSYGKCKRQEKKRVEDFEMIGGERMMVILKPEAVMCSRKETEVQTEPKMNVVQEDGGQDEPIKPKYRKEKKKPKEKGGKLDTRTEEEKLWDDSILGF